MINAWQSEKGNVIFLLYKKNKSAAHKHRCMTLSCRMTILFLFCGRLHAQLLMHYKLQKIEGKHSLCHCVSLSHIVSLFSFISMLVNMVLSVSDSNGVGGVGRLRPERAFPAADGRLEFGACLQLAAQRPQDFQELTPELHTHKGVQDGIEAAVEVTH